MIIDAHKLSASDSDLAKKYPAVREFDGYAKFNDKEPSALTAKQTQMPWVKGMHIDEKQKFLCCWTDAHILYLYNFNTFDIDCQTTSLQGSEEERL